MKRKIQSLVIVGLLLVIAIACQREERETLESKGISLEQAKAFFEKQETEKENNGIDFKITPKWDTFKEEEQEDDINFASVEVFVNDDTNTKAQAFFSKKEKEIQLKLYFTSNEKDNTQWIVITDANGLFQEAFIQKSKSSLFERKYKRRIVITIGSDPEMPYVGTDDPNIEMVDQYGMTIPSSKRYLYTYKLQGIVHTEMNVIRGVLNKRILDEKAIELSEVILNYYYNRHDREAKSSLNLARIRTFFNSQSSGINDFIHLERKKDRFKGVGGNNSNSNTKSDPYKGLIRRPDSIINKLTDPCARKLLSQMLATNTRINFLKSVNLKSHKRTFSEHIIDMFERSSETHLIFQNSNDTGNANGSTKGTTITLNNNYLKNATSLAIARTIIHEMVHAYLNATHRYRDGFKNKDFHKLLTDYFNDNKAKYSSDPKIHNRLHHEFMGQYIEAMAISLQQWDIRYGTRTDLGLDYYKALSYGGLFQTDANGTITTETDSFKELVPNAKDRQDIANKILNEQNNNGNAKGTKCK
ncbi:hypothetical protein CAPN004_12320 [Capnocytophaga cynodegmi]|uniref:SprT-like domain-containing protein n=1 Tax=Capnocytophaga cynodegmi TaxID=28189 RepID=UPI001AC8B036|nr:SprT-like domain-containing protein [Capnocytophaga cynodegmi]GIM52202.1 hypothetical protein CAPN004_12320 [Capnocytophaga cynodegmi]